MGRGERDFRTETPFPVQFAVVDRRMKQLRVGGLYFDFGSIGCGSQVRGHYARP
jgi:hypothetical protein